jgi:hypothetical protein
MGLRHLLRRVKAVTHHVILALVLRILFVTHCSYKVAIQIIYVAFIVH